MLDSKRSPLARAVNYITFAARSRAFSAYGYTLGLGLGLYLADVVSDAYNAAAYFSRGHKWWGSQTLGEEKKAS